MKKLFILFFTIFCFLLSACRHDATGYFYVKSVDNGYVVAIDSSDMSPIIVTKTLNLEKSKKICDELNINLGNAALPTPGY